MTLLASYVLKVALCSGVLYLYYAVALKNKVFHQWNRFYLLASVVLSVVLPLIQVAIIASEEQSDALRFIKTLQAADSYLDSITITAQTQSFDTAEWLFAGYTAGSIVLLLLLGNSLLKIKRLLKAHKVQRLAQIKFVNTREPGTPFSFLRYIFWHQDISLQSDAGRWIFEHELVHVTEKHTADKLFVQTVLSLFWCNPFFWLMRRELSFVHEFIADKKSVGHHGTAAFAAMVLQASFPQQYSSITNSFFQLSIKRRFAMLTKQNNPKLNYALRIIALPLLALVIFAFSVRTKENFRKPNLSNAVVAFNNDTIPKAQRKIESVDVNKSKGLMTIYYTDGSCETMTEQEANKRGLINDGGFANAKRGTIKLARRNTELRTKDTLANPIYVIDNVEATSDVVNSLSPNAIASINVLKGDMAMKLYGEKGKNGVVEITTKAYNASPVSSHPIYFVDGVEIDEKQMKEIDPAKIASINILKGPSAVAKYGDKGANGIIEITMKRGDGKSTIFQVDNSYATSGEIKTADWDKGSLKLKESLTLNDTTRPNEPLFTQTETPASVNKDEWRVFLSKSLQPIIENSVKKGMKSGQYVVNVRFLVKKDGSLSDFQAMNNPGYDLDKQVLAIMPNSPKWKPAEQNGKIVNSYHVQPITFKIQEQ